MRRIYIDFYADNLELLRKGLKTSTLRSTSQSYKIDLDIGESAMFEDFIVTHHGLKFVQEVGGAEAIWKSEGFDYTETGKPKFSQTYDFLDGQIPLHYYTFSKK